MPALLSQSLQSAGETEKRKGAHRQHRTCEWGSWDLSGSDVKAGGGGAVGGRESCQY